MSNGDFWSAKVWTQFNGSPFDKTQPGLLKTTMGPIQVAQQVFNTIVTGNDNSIPGDTIIDPDAGKPSAGETRTFVTLLKPFQLYPLHINDPSLSMASNQVTRAAQALALAEESLFYLGKCNLPGVKLPEGNQDKLYNGLLGIAAQNLTISVGPPQSSPQSPPQSPPQSRRHSPPRFVNARQSPRWGLQTYEAVVTGIEDFTNQEQGPPYAVILSPDTFADANFPLNNNAMVIPASAIQALLASGPFVMSPGMPSQTGLLASLGGQATTLYIGTSPLVEYNRFEESVHYFSARESIQFLNTDKRSLIKLEFN